MHIRSRTLWPDAAKGVCIGLVVLIHVVSKQFLTMGWQMPNMITLGWDGASYLMTPIRMPLFFAISGYFSVAYLTRPWRITMGRRLVPLFALYVLWLTIHTLFFSLTPDPPTMVADGVGGYLLAVVLGYTSLWYLYALLVYLALTKLVIRFAGPALVSAAVISVLSATTVIPSIGNTPSLLRNYVFFIAGSVFAPHITRLAQGWDRKRVVGWLVLFVLVSGGYSAGRFATELGNFSVDLGLSVLQLLASVLGIVVGVGVISTAATSWRRICIGLAWFGRRTFPIYVLHLPLLSLMTLALSGMSIPLPILAVYPALATVGLMLMSVWISAAASRMGGGWIFEPRSWKAGPPRGQATHTTAPMEH